MNTLAALWRFLGFRWSLSVLVGVVTIAGALSIGAPPGPAILLAVGPPACVAAHERLTILPNWRRWLRTGRGAAGDWMSPVELKRHSRPLPRRLP